MTPEQVYLSASSCTSHAMAVVVRAAEALGVRPPRCLCVKSILEDDEISVVIVETVDKRLVRRLPFLRVAAGTNLTAEFHAEFDQRRLSFLPSWLVAVRGVRCLDIVERGNLLGNRLSL
jgi:hypothetical protein